MTRMPASSGNGRSRAASSMSGRVTATTPDSNPAAPTPAPAIRNLRRLNSAMSNPLHRQVFGGVDGGCDESLWVVDQFLERGRGAVSPRADTDEIAGGVDAVTLGGVHDGRQVTQRRELVCRPHPGGGAGRGEPRP